MQVAGHINLKNMHACGTGCKYIYYLRLTALTKKSLFNFAISIFLLN